jgi:hypothetical protein
MVRRAPWKYRENISEVWERGSGWCKGRKCRGDLGRGLEEAEDLVMAWKGIGTWSEARKGIGNSARGLEGCGKLSPRLGRLGLRLGSAGDSGQAPGSALYGDSMSRSARTPTPCTAEQPSTGYPGRHHQGHHGCNTAPGTTEPTCLI